jgi:hypothetical protein
LAIKFTGEGEEATWAKEKGGANSSPTMLLPMESSAGEAACRLLGVGCRRRAVGRQFLLVPLLSFLFLSSSEAPTFSFLPNLFSLSPRWC